MDAFEFGYVVGASEKTANVGSAILNGALTLNPVVHGGVHALAGAPIGAALGAYNAPKGEKLRGAGRGALTGAATGAGVGAAGALAGRAIGGFPGMIERGFAGGLKNNLINQIPNLASIGGGAAGYQLAKQRPQPQAKAANALTATRPLVGELVRQAPIVAKVVPQRAAQAGSNAMKYLGVGAAGLAAGAAGSKLLNGVGQQQQPQAKAANAGAPTAFKSDAHPTSFIPLVGGAISGAVRPNPSRGPVSNVLGEGGAGLAGGLRGGFGGAALGAGLGALRGVRGLGAGAAIGGLLGSAIGTHRGAQTFRENTPLNARALEMLKAQPAAAPVKAATFGANNIVAPTRQTPPRFTLPQGMQQRARQNFESGVGKMFGQTAQKAVTGLNNVGEMIQSAMPSSLQTYVKADSNNWSRY